MGGDWPKQLTRQPRGLSWASMALNVRHFGPVQQTQPTAQRDRALFGFHIGNISLHAVNSLLLWWVYWKLGKKNPWLAALLFSAHPLASSSVGYISGRSAVLSGTFSIGAMGLMASKHPGLAMLPLTMAVMAKEDSASVAVALYGAGKHAGIKRAWMIFIPVLAGGIWKRDKIRRVLSTNGETAIQQCGFPKALSGPDYQTTALTGLLQRLPFWTVGQRQSVDPLLKTVSWKDPAFHLTALITASVIFGLSRLPATRLSLFWIIGSPMSVYLLFPMPDPIMEYRAYFTTAGIADGLASITDRYPAAALPLLTYFSIQTYRRNLYFTDPFRYWGSALNEHSRQDRAYINLGVEQLNQAVATENRVGVERNKARAYFSQALQVNPDLALARGDIALMDRKEGRLPEAIAGFQETVRRSPDHHQSWYYLGTCFEDVQQLDEAANAYRTATETNYRFTNTPYYPAVNRLGIVAVKQHRLDDAIRHFREASTLQPASIDYRFNYAMALKLADRMPEAMPIFKTLPKQIPLSTEMLRVQEEKKA
jgi:Flp pilus assembly protein TadD